MLLSELLAPARVRVPLRSQTKDDLLRELVDLAAGEREPAAAASILASVREREQVLSTGIGDGIAIPHAKTPLVESLIVAAGVCARPVDFDSLDGSPVKVCFLLIGPDSAASDHVKALSRISRLLRRDALRAALRDAESSEAFVRVVQESEVA